MQIFGGGMGYTHFSKISLYLVPKVAKHFCGTFFVTIMSVHSVFYLLFQFQMIMGREK